MLILLSFLLIGTVTVYHFKSENETYHEERLKRKEKAVLTSIDYFIHQAIGTNDPDSIVLMFNNKICELADINNLDINIYNLKGELLISSHTDYFESHVFVFKLGTEILDSLDVGEHTYTQSINMDTLHIKSTYGYLNDAEGDPFAIFNIPYFHNKNSNQIELKSFLVRLSEIYILLFIGASFIAYLLSNYITGSLKTVGEKLKQIEIGKKNTPLEWIGNDEIGTLINEYNRMINELEKNVQRLAQSERESAWRDMAKQVAHEIKNPLTPMKLSVQHLVRSISQNPEDSEARLNRFSQTMIEQIDTLSHIASEFSNFAKMPEAKSEAINLVDLISSSIDLYKDTPRVQFTSNMHDLDAANVRGDKDQMIRVIGNLLKNAIQAFDGDEEEHTIAIRLYKDEDLFHLEIKDDGCGMNSELKNRIFTPYFTTKTSGTGLGLAMVKNIIEHANGTIELESQEGKGTTFFITLPQA